MSLAQLTIEGRTDQYPSYATVDEADEYLAVEPTYTAAWAAIDTAGNNTKKIYLIAATRYLDGLLWAGDKAVATQDTQWPRSGLTDRDGNDVAAGAVPTAIEQAVILLAADLSLDSEALSTDAAEDNVASERIGPKSVSYFRPRRTSAKQRIRNRRVLALVSYWLGVRGPTPPFVSGTDGVSSFTGLDRYGRSEGAA